MVAQLLEGVEPEAKRRCIRIDHQVNQHAKTLQAIPDQFVLVLSNLIHNGIKYSFDGTADHPKVFGVRYSPEGENVVISFENDGCGIERDEIAERKLFELGYRGVASGDRGRPGTGTGLYVADKITKAHDGQIRVFSKRIGGQEFEYPMHENRFELVWPVYSKHLE